MYLGSFLLVCKKYDYYSTILRLEGSEMILITQLSAPKTIEVGHFELEFEYGDVTYSVPGWGSTLADPSSEEIGCISLPPCS